MNPPENIQGIILKRFGKNKFNILFKTKLKPDHFIIKDFNTNIIECLFKYSQKYNYQFDPKSQIIKLNNIKLDHINYSQRKKMGAINIILTIKNNTSSENKHSYELEYQCINQGKIIESIPNIICNIILKNYELSININYTDDTPGKLDHFKYQGAHFLRNSLIPFKNEIEK